MPKEQCSDCGKELEKKDTRVYFHGNVWQDEIWQNDLDGKVLVLCRDCTQKLINPLKEEKL